MHYTQSPTITLTFIILNFTILFRMSANIWVLPYTLFVTSIASQQTYLHRTTEFFLTSNLILSTQCQSGNTPLAIPPKEFEVPFNISFPDLCIGKLAQKYNAQCSFYWEILHSMDILDKDLSSQLKSNVNIVKHLFKSQKKGRMPRALDFIGDGLEYMFGTVSAKTLRQVITQMESSVDEYVSNLKNNVVSLTDALASHQVVIDSETV